VTEAGKPEPLATPGQVAEVLGVPEHTLAQWRSRGKGPRYCRVGRHVRYRWPVVNAWVDKQEKGGTRG
jgi:Helix-turn-helix domain